MQRHLAHPSRLTRAATIVGNARTHARMLMLNDADAIAGVASCSGSVRDAERIRMNRVSTSLFVSDIRVPFVRRVAAVRYGRGSVDQRRVGRPVYIHSYVIGSVYSTVAGQLPKRNCIRQVDRVTDIARRSVGVGSMG